MIKFGLAVALTIKAFPQYQNEEWYQELETCQWLIPLLNGQVRSQEDFSKCPKLAPFSRRGSPFMLPEAERPGSQYKFVEAKFMDLDGCLKNIFEQSQELPAPSTYCLGTHYRRSQLNSQMAVCDGRMGTAPVANQLLFSMPQLYIVFESPVRSQLVPVRATCKLRGDSDSKESGESIKTK